MGNSSSINKKSQSIIETSFMFIAAILLLLGIFRIGLWYHNELAERQPAYQASRVAAGSSEIGKWPVYARRPLTENWVLKGEDFPSAQQAAGGGIGPGRPRNTECEKPAKAKEEQAKNNIKQAWVLESEASQLESEASQLESEAADLDKQAEDYQKLYTECLAYCYADCYECYYYKELADDYRAQAQQKHDQAQQKLDQAQEKRQKAQQLRDEAEQLFAEALEIRKSCWK